MDMGADTGGSIKAGTARFLTEVTPETHTIINMLNDQMSARGSADLPLGNFFFQRLDYPRGFYELYFLGSPMS